MIQEQEQQDWRAFEKAMAKAREVYLEAITPTRRVLDEARAKATKVYKEERAKEKEEKMTNIGGDYLEYINYGIVCNKCDQIHNENWDCEIRRTDELNPDDRLLTINEWLDAIGCDRAYKKDMKEAYQKAKVVMEIRQELHKYDVVFVGKPGVDKVWENIQVKYGLTPLPPTDRQRKMMSELEQRDFLGRPDLSNATDTVYRRIKPLPPPERKGEVK